VPRRLDLPGEELHVGAGAEGAPRTGENGDPHAAVAIDVAKRRVNSAPMRGTQAFNRAAG